MVLYNRREQGPLEQLSRCDTKHQRLLSLSNHVTIDAHYVTIKYQCHYEDEYAILNHRYACPVSPVPSRFPRRPNMSQKEP